MSKTKFFAAICCAAMLFAACEKNEPTKKSSEEPIDQDQEQKKDTIILTGTESGHDWVDLGLPSGIKWATCNVGSEKTEGYGNYYAWGETDTKESFSWETYKYGTYDCDEDYSKLTKYNQTDSIQNLEAIDDVATQWGGNWRMPTTAEWNELLTKCTWTWTAKDSVNGYEVKSKNGYDIFLPAAGCRFDDGLYFAGSVGNYWSSSLGTLSPDRAQYVYFRSDIHCVSYYDRNYGLSVRPVLNK